MSGSIDKIFNYVKQTKNYTSNVENELKKLDIYNITTYFPPYKLIFKLNNNNYNSILLKNKFQFKNIKNIHNCNSVIIECFDSTNQDHSYTKKCFIKYAPLIEPFQYLCGKQEFIESSKENKLPVFNTDDVIDYNSVIDSPFNHAYVDCFFSYLSSQIKNNYNFKNGIDFYGNFCGIKNNFKVSITEDLTLLNNSTFFTENINKLFRFDNSIEFEPITSRSRSLKKNETLNFDDVIDVELDTLNETQLGTFFNMEISEDTNESADIGRELREVIFDKNKLDELDIKSNKSTTTEKSNCSSRTSYTTQNSIDIDTENIDTNNSSPTHDDVGEKVARNSLKSYSEISLSNSEDGDDYSDVLSDSDGETDVNVYLDNFPVNMILLEHCQDTLHDYIENNEVEERELASILLQILFTLATYQHCFNFTHNDLHSNNIMFSKTTEKYLYYALDDGGPVYKIPTFGKIWKIIDFGRSIYNISNQVIENLSYSEMGDATTQYNFGKLYCYKYNKHYPNNNFDLCRLGCCLFDYFFDTEDCTSKIVFDKNMNQLVYNDTQGITGGFSFNVKNLILKWITDKDNHNILYKSSGEERYPGFKLYKMISIKANNRCCPVQNIKSPYFNSFIYDKTQLSNEIIKNKLFVVSTIPVFYTIEGLKYDKMSII